MAVALWLARWTLWWSRTVVMYALSVTTGRPEEVLVGEPTPPPGVDSLATGAAEVVVGMGEVGAMVSGGRSTGPMFDVVVEVWKVDEPGVVVGQGHVVTETYDHAVSVKVAV